MVQGWAICTKGERGASDEPYAHDSLPAGTYDMDHADAAHNCVAGCASLR